MAEDMQLRNLAPATIDAYTYHVDKFCRHFGKPADQLGPEEIRQYRLFLVNEKKASWSSFMIYLHVRRQHFDRSPSPIDWLPVRQCPKWAEESLSQSILPQAPQPPTAQTPRTTENTGDTSTEKPPSPVRRTSGRKPRKPRKRRRK